MFKFEKQADPSFINTMPVDNCFIYGLFMEGCRFEGGYLVDP